MDGLLYETTPAESLLPTGLAYRPETLTPLLALLSARALGDPPINHAKALSALGDIVGRLDIGAGDKRPSPLSVQLWVPDLTGGNQPPGTTCLQTGTWMIAICCPSAVLPKQRPGSAPMGTTYRKILAEVFAPIRYPGMGGLWERARPYADQTLRLGPGLLT